MFHGLVNTSLYPIVVSYYVNEALISQVDAQSQPELTFSGASPSKTYIVIELDIDAPFPSFPKLGPILHWVQPGFKLSSTGVLESTEPFIANYIGPAPPPVSSPHRYTFFLYEQPDGLDIKKFALPEYSSKPSVVTGRMWASLDDWEKKLGLGQVVAVNYYKSN